MLRGGRCALPASYSPVGFLSARLASADRRRRSRCSHLRKVIQWPNSGLAFARLDGHVDTCNISAARPVLVISSPTSQWILDTAPDQPDACICPTPSFRPAGLTRDTGTTLLCNFLQGMLGPRRACSYDIAPSNLIIKSHVLDPPHFRLTACCSVLGGGWGGGRVYRDHAATGPAMGRIHQPHAYRRLRHAHARPAARVLAGSRVVRVARVAGCVQGATLPGGGSAGPSDERGRGAHVAHGLLRRRPVLSRASCTGSTGPPTATWPARQRREAEREIQKTRVPFCALSDICKTLGVSTFECTQFGVCRSWYGGACGCIVR